MSLTISDFARAGLLEMSACGDCPNAGGCPTGQCPLEQLSGLGRRRSKTYRLRLKRLAAERAKLYAAYKASLQAGDRSRAAILAGEIRKTDAAIVRAQGKRAAIHAQRRESPGGGGLFPSVATLSTERLTRRLDRAGREIAPGVEPGTEPVPEERPVGGGFGLVGWGLVGTAGLGIAYALARALAARRRA